MGARKGGRESLLDELLGGTYLKVRETTPDPFQFLGGTYLKIREKTPDPWADENVTRCVGRAITESKKDYELASL